jgi:hypothetical protein
MAAKKGLIKILTGIANGLFIFVISDVWSVYYLNKSLKR